MSPHNKDASVYLEGQSDQRVVQLGIKPSAYPKRQE